MSKKEIIVVVLILIAIATRFLFLVDGQSILPNFTAVGAIAILGASHLKGARRWILPLVVLWVSDLILNNIVYAEYYTSFQIFGSAWVYGAFLLIGVIAYYVMNKGGWVRLAFTGIAGAVVFFLITNLGSWASITSPYTKDFSGLLTAYEAGIPFFRNTLISNLVFSFALFGAYEFLASRLSDVDPVMSTKSMA